MKEISKIGWLSMAKLHGIIALTYMIIVGLPVFLLGALADPVTSWIVYVFFLVASLAGGAELGVLNAGLYNVYANFFGGIEVELT